jgi:dynein assembly factor 1
MTAGVTYPRRRPKKEAEDELITMGSSEMSLARLRKILESDRRLYYHSFDLNDKLYIHFQGFRKLDNLDKFTGLRSLYAEANAFEKIEGLEACTQLRSLFIQQNCIKKIEGLENNLDLWSLNLSENWISCIENLDHLRTLNSLTITKNRIGHGGLRDVLGLKHTTIATLDLSDNHIQDPEIVPEVLAKMTELRVLYLKGNPVVRNIPNYRKTVIASLPDLKYLDDRPVFEEDRRYAEAFVAGGLEGEREMRRIIKKEKEDYHTKQMQAFQRMMAEGKERKREIAGMRAEDKYTDETDPVETWKRRQERFTREHPEYDYEEAGAWDKKVSGDTTKKIPKLDVNFKETPEDSEATKVAKVDAKKAEAEAKPGAGIVTAAKEGTAAAALEKKMIEQEEKDKAVKEAPPPPKWDEDIFSSKPSVKPAEANKAAMNFAPAPRAKAPPAFGPRPTPGNELDELD